jgi:hypothetical protein
MLADLVGFGFGVIADAVGPGRLLGGSIVYDGNIRILFIAQICPAQVASTFKFERPRSVPIEMEATGEAEAGGLRLMNQDTVELDDCGLVDLEMVSCGWC